jgi:hypothetical protein
MSCHDTVLHDALISICTRQCNLDMLAIYILANSVWLSQEPRIWFYYPARGKVIGRVIVVIVLSTKIAISRDIGTWVTHKHNESIEFREKLASVSFKSRDTVHEHDKSIEPSNLLATIIMGLRKVLITFVIIISWSYRMWLALLPAAWYSPLFSKLKTLGNLEPC